MAALFIIACFDPPKMYTSLKASNKTDEGISLLKSFNNRW